ncbi:MAG: GH32 C-terminal domain-containing protein [Bacteroidales bacterium]|nr:GH32 C-terminal domain-containing protein [Bacteroidales bacterium]MCF8336651.1 GH32 C-terminal domain-containing protein [Bacteroidales bacterium]
MILAAQDRVRLYSSPDLKSWEYESSFGKNAGAHGGVWECPDLFPLQAEGDSAKEKWVMLVNVNPGGPNGGSATQYFIGDFDGHSFTPDTKTTKWADYGKDNYAGVTWSDIPEEDGRRIYLGWMSNWEYAENVPTYHWRNSMTLPRTVKLKNENGDYQLRFSPVKELQTLRTEKTVIKKKLISGSEKLTKAHSIPAEIKLEFTLNKKSQFGSASKFGMRLSNGSNEELLVGYNEATEQLYIDRRKSGKTKFAETFPTVQRAPLKVDNKLSMRIYVDKASVELFVNDGERVMTSIVFPNQVYDSFDLFAENGSVYLESAKVHQLSSIWK